MRLTIEALQANDGDCLLVHYARTDAPTLRILVDGGSRGIYRDILRPRIDQLRQRGTLDLRMVLVSHVDLDHITGVLDLFRDLERVQDNGGEPFCRIRTLWHNAFEQVHRGRQATLQSAAVSASLGGVAPSGLNAQAAAVVASVRQGAALRDVAERLGIVRNESAMADLVRAPEDSVRRITIAPGLSLTILGPHDAQLRKLDEEWRRSEVAHPADPAAQAADYLNRTAANLSSIVLLLEAERAGGGSPVRVLLTGDAGGDHILESLDRTGIGPGGRIHVDLLKVQHHGSNHSTTQDFFERVTADRYVISGNGKHGIPHADALAWLSAARRGQPYKVYMTNRTGLEGLEQVLTGFLAREAAAEPRHQYLFRRPERRFISTSFR
jgi:beta-lactamase superfamily II metal-dependent hydrolase